MFIQMETFGKGDLPYAFNSAYVTDVLKVDDNHCKIWLVNSEDPIMVNIDFNELMDMLNS